MSVFGLEFHLGSILLKCEKSHSDDPGTLTVGCAGGIRLESRLSKTCRVDLSLIVCHCWAEFDS